MILCELVSTQGSDLKVKADLGKYLETKNFVVRLFIQMIPSIQEIELDFN